MNRLHRGKTLRLEQWDYSAQRGYFITTCVKGRHQLFGQIKNKEMYLSSAGKIVRDIWVNLPNQVDCRIDTFVIMPDHFHGIIFITNHTSPPVEAIHELPLQRIIPRYQVLRRQMTLPMVIGRFKMQTAKLINQIVDRSGQALWQSNYYEHVIRSEQDLQRIRLYIENNPLNWKGN
ncbi:MAG: transposase [Candidatus Kerfeldbacteria bacterium]|nr:transposase [Candidatus Kerfeldbacteria bacterium]